MIGSIDRDARAVIFWCHPDKASNASGMKDLGQRRESAAGSGSALPHPMKIRSPARHLSKGTLRDFKTGTGFTGAKLSEILPAARVARFVRMTDLRSRCSLRSG
jgi:hypothetical protein